MRSNIFGTDGIRARMGSEFFNTQSLMHIGSAIAQWAQLKFGHPPRILLGHDTRESCAFVKSAMQSGLLLNGSIIYDTQIMPTPVICQIVGYSNQFDLGLIISASHNPYYDNGIKLVCAQSGKISHEDELAISALYYQQASREYSYSSFGATYYWPHAYQEYIKTLEEFMYTGFLTGKKIVLDCAHGATYQFAQQVFHHFGAQVIVINNQPTGININEKCGALHLNSLQDAVIAHKADIGFAFDGDGDRVIAVNSQGIIKDGDDILAMLMQHISYEQESGIVGTVMTNQGFAVYLHEKNKKLLRTPVGDKYISEQLIKDTLLLGGEQSGHIIMRDYMDSGDGIFTALRLVQALMHSNNWAMNTFNKFPQILINVPIVHKKDLSQPEFAQLIADHEAQLHGGRLLVRYSGTEPVLRVMVEDADLDTAQQVGTHLSQLLAQQLSL
jgi:phosphoglucosamine mutase